METGGGGAEPGGMRRRSVALLFISEGRGFGSLCWEELIIMTVGWAKGFNFFYLNPLFFH